MRVWSLSLDFGGGLGYFLSTVIVLAPVLSNYVLLGPISIGDFLCVAAVVPLVKYFRVDLLSIGVGFAAISTILIGLSVLFRDEMILGFFRMAFYYLLFFFLISLREVSFKKFNDIYIACAIIFSVSLIIQWTAYSFSSVSISLQLPIPYYELDTLEVVDHIFRSGGWFKEPSYFAIFVAPALFYLANAKAYVRYFLVAFAGIVSTSSLAVFVIMLSAVYFLIRFRVGGFILVWLLLTLALALLGIFHFGAEWIFVSRVVDIFTSGGTLNERLVPILDILLLSESITPNPVAFDLVSTAGDSGLVWYSSAAYILASLGWLGCMVIFSNFFRLGLLGGLILSTLTLTSHIFSGAYSFFIVVAFLGLNMEFRRLGLPRNSGAKFSYVGS